MEKELWEKCAAFHGHECGGLTIGYKAALYAIKLLGLRLPEPARIFRSIRCSRCGESTSEHLIRLCGDEKLCLDCYQAYNRFAV